MNTLKCITLAILVAPGLTQAATVLSQANTEPPPPKFEILDVNADGFVTGSEALAAGIMEEAFAQMDRDGDGQLTSEEYEHEVRGRI